MIGRPSLVARPDGACLDLPARLDAELRDRRALVDRRDRASTPKMRASRRSAARAPRCRPGAPRRPPPRRAGQVVATPSRARSVAPSAVLSGRLPVFLRLARDDDIVVTLLERFDHRRRLLLSVAFSPVFVPLRHIRLVQQLCGLLLRPWHQAREEGLKPAPDARVDVQVRDLLPEGESPLAMP